MGNPIRAQLYFPAAEINPYGNGAAKRSAQISSFLERHFNIVNINKLQLNYHPIVQRYINGIQKTVQHKIHVNSLKSLSMTGHHFLEAQQIVKDFAPTNLFWESTWVNYHYKPFFYKDLNLKLFGFPHNLESLVAGHKSPVSKKMAPQWLNEEMEQLSLCNHVFTISKEENWLLNLHGIPSTYYPYFPPPETEKGLLEIRQIRTYNQKEEYFLIFGSFTYPPIRQGLIELLNYLTKNDIAVPIVITGFGSDTIAKLFQQSLPRNIKFVGTSTTSQLNQHLSKCKGVLINQAASSGALTKIVELQVAGIPIIANMASTRSYDNSKGLYPFSNFLEMTSFLKQNLELPTLPTSPLHIENTMLQIIQHTK